GFSLAKPTWITPLSCNSANLPPSPSFVSSALFPELPHAAKTNIVISAKIVNVNFLIYYSLLPFINNMYYSYNDEFRFTTFVLVHFKSTPFILSYIIIIIHHNYHLHHILLFLF